MDLFTVTREPANKHALCHGLDIAGEAIRPQSSRPSGTIGIRNLVCRKDRIFLFLRFEDSRLHTMQALSRLQRRILALLEEAGELDLVAMINSVAIPKGHPEELEAVRTALIGLLSLGLVTLGYELLPISADNIPLEKQAALQLLERLDCLTEWSDDIMYWQINPRMPLYNIVVTDSGYETAKRILEEDGWPAEPLPEYE